MIPLDDLPLWLQIAGMGGYIVFGGVAFYSFGVYLDQRREAEGHSDRVKKGVLAASFLIVALSVTADVTLLLTTGVGTIERLYRAFF